MEGTLDYRLCAKMNTEEMGVFLQQVSQQYPDEYLLTTETVRCTTDINLEGLNSLAFLQFVYSIPRSR